MYHLLLTLDLLESYLADYSADEFTASLSAQNMMALNLVEISQLVREVSMETRLAYPAMNWAFLRNLSMYMSEKNISTNAQIAWLIVHRRVLPVREILAAIVQSLDHLKSLSA